MIWFGHFSLFKHKSVLFPNSGTSAYLTYSLHFKVMYLKIKQGLVELLHPLFFPSRINSAQNGCLKSTTRFRASQRRSFSAIFDCSKDSFRLPVSPSKPGEPGCSAFFFSFFSPFLFHRLQRCWDTIRTCLCCTLNTLQLFKHQEQAAATQTTLPSYL